MCLSWKKIKPKDVIILDNGVYEQGESIDPRALIDIALDINADWVVAPDVPFHKDENLKRFDEFIRLCARAEATFGVLGVLHGEAGNRADFSESIRHMVSHNTCSRKGLCLSRLISAFDPTDFPYPEVGRIKLAERIRTSYGNQFYLHALGMPYGTAELFGLRMSGVNSIDSSAPFWRGLHGYDINDYKGWRAVDTPLNFQANRNFLDHMVYERSSVIKHNLIKVRRACNL